MKFRTKLILGFTIVVFLISSVLGIVSYSYNSRRLSDKAKQSLEFYSGQLTSAVDVTVDSMKHLTDYILSDADMLFAMQSMPKLHALGNDIERKKQTDILVDGLATDYVLRNFYRVIVFNEMGDVISSTNAGSKITNKKRNISKIPWLSEAADMHGKPILIGPHEDGWSLQGKRAKVFSLARKVQGGDFGYIEVQMDMEKMDASFRLADESVMVAAWIPDGSLLYCSDNFTDSELLKTLQKRGGVKTTASSGTDWAVSETVSENYGIRVAAVQNGTGLLADTRQALLLAVVLALGCFVVSMGVAVLVANKLSRPIVMLRERMENTGIENLDAEPITVNADDEVAALSIAYQNLTRRLNESMVKERRLSLLQLQAQFDTLQAQVNPHFLYNVLNVISSRGVLSGDEEICEICGSLAAMLRYSTNTKERYATVEKEVEYLRQYIFLLKSRYEHRLEVEIDWEESLKGEILPKIVLQQLVENCVQHGYQNSKSVMRVCVRGWRDGNGWYFEVRDNGQGITDEVQEELMKKIDRIRRRILSRDSSIEMEIGGMGLANTYARMFLLYNGRAVFRIRNLDEGVSVMIGVSDEEGE